MRSSGTWRSDRPLLNRDFILITLTSFIFFFNYHSFILLPLRIEELGGSESTIGFIMGAASMATILTTPSVGILIDKWGKKWFLLAGGLLMSVTSLPFAFLDSLEFGFPALKGTARGRALPLFRIRGDAHRGRIFPREKEPGYRRYSDSFSVINFALAPYIGKKIVEAYGFGDLFIFDFIFGSSAFIAALFIREPEPLSRTINRGAAIRRLFQERGI